MSWSTAADLRAQIQKLWDSGHLLAAGIQADAILFPRRLRLIGPTSAELAGRFDEVRQWMAALRDGTTRLRIEQREFRHRVLGNNAVPDEVWVDTLDDALALIGRQKEAKRFAAVVQWTNEREPLLLPWLARRALQALAMADDWPRLLAVVAWLRTHPKPGIYLRQVDLPGVDSKFIESWRGVLSELLDLTLPAEAINPDAVGVSQFCRRYGFQDKPLRIRCRLLDTQLMLLPTRADQDIGMTREAFRDLALPVNKVFITENEINFLAFPAVPRSLVIFGSGYGFEMLADVTWLHDKSIYYWGDIDTHGFAILDQLRAQFAHVNSLLMDRATLLAHEAHWGTEAKPVLRDLPRLTVTECALYDDLRDQRLRFGVRLEQERIGFGWVQSALAGLPAGEAVSR